MSRKAHKAERKARREAAREVVRQPSRGKLTRWRCARRCGAGEWTHELDVPMTCPECGARVDIER